MVEEAPETARRLAPRRVLAACLAIGALLLAAPFASSEVRARAQVAWIARGIRSPDIAAREEARRRLLEIGRPAIDAVYPELVAQAVEEQCRFGGRRIVFVGVAHVRNGPARHGEVTFQFHRDAIEVLEGALSVNEVAVQYPRPQLKAPTLLAADGWRQFERVDFHREIIVGSLAYDEPTKVVLNLRVAARVDDDLAPATITAVKEALRTLGPFRDCPVCGERRPATGECPHCGVK